MNDRSCRNERHAAATLLAAFFAVFGLAATADAAPGDAKFCKSYAANVAGMGDLAIKKNPACLDYSKGVHGNFSMHYDWCMKNPASSVQGAESNIRRLVTACTGNVSAPASKASSTQPKTVQSSPTGTEKLFGRNIGVWQFTRDAGGLCRAYSPGPGGSNIIARRADGYQYVSVWGGGFAKGDYPGSYMTIAGREERIDGGNGGVRFLMKVDNDRLNRIVRARGFEWRVMDHGRVVRASANFDGSIDAAMDRINECMKGNGAATAKSEQEPFGAGFDGWKFTQEATSKGILCRAWFGSNVVARYANAGMYLSVPSGKIVKGSYPETFLQIGKDSEPVDAKSDGKRFSLQSDQGFLNKLASTQGYNYRTGPVNGKFITGTIAFNGSTGRALKELVACSKANGGR